MTTVASAAVAMLAAAVAQAAGTPAPADPIAASFAGWYTEIEDDLLPTANSPVYRVETSGCTTRITGAPHLWSIDWRNARAIVREDVFIYIDAPPLKLAAVTDAGSAAGQARLGAMHDAMTGLARRCDGLSMPTPP